MHSCYGTLITEADILDFTIFKDQLSAIRRWSTDEATAKKINTQRHNVQASDWTRKEHQRSTVMQLKCSEDQFGSFGSDKATTTYGWSFLVFDSNECTQQSQHACQKHIHFQKSNGYKCESRTKNDFSAINRCTVKVLQCAFAFYLVTVSKRGRVRVITLKSWK